MDKKSTHAIQIQALSLPSTLDHSFKGLRFLIYLYPTLLANIYNVKSSQSLSEANGFR